jgi:hypothetical protein
LLKLSPGVLHTIKARTTKSKVPLHAHKTVPTSVFISALLAPGHSRQPHAPTNSCQLIALLVGLRVDAKR